MRKTLTLLLLGIFYLSAGAQKLPAPAVLVQPYGIIDTADLRMQSCDFEKDANAMVLFDKLDESFDDSFDVTYIRHKRIKIFNNNGKDQADLNISYIDRIVDIEAETINLNGKTIEYTPVDTKLIHNQKVDNYNKALVFSFPNVKAGSVVELQYKWRIHSGLGPNWYFQSDIPNRYSEIDLSFRNGQIIRVEANVRQPFFKDSTIVLNGWANYGGKKYIRAMANVPSFKTEPFMPQKPDYLQRLILRSNIDYWFKISNGLLYFFDFGQQMNKKIAGEKELLAKADLIKDKDVKIDSIFNWVKHRMVWNNINRWCTDAGTQKAWDKKTGNSTEINLILYDLLSKAGVTVYPVMVSTPDYGVVDTANADIREFNKTVVLASIDSVSNYILDASDKNTMYNQAPFDLLSTEGFLINPLNSKNTFFQIKYDVPAKELVSVNATIQADGKMIGSADIVSDSYCKEQNLKLYKDLGEKKYIGYLADNANELKISSLNREDTGTDSIPLTQHVNFSLDLTSSDQNYIYFNPNLFTSFNTNPFLTENRVSDVDFTHNSTCIISGAYKIPAGYKVEALPKNQILVTEDKCITFKRLLEEQDGTIMVHYVIKRTRSYYTNAEYRALYKFYTEMFRMLNEQIVLKKT